MPALHSARPLARPTRNRRTDAGNGEYPQDFDMTYFSFPSKRFFGTSIPGPRKPSGKDQLPHAVPGFRACDFPSHKPLSRQGAIRDMKEFYGEANRRRSDQPNMIELPIERDSFKWCGPKNMASS